MIHAHAGETIIGKFTQAAGNNASIGGLKVVTENGWFGPVLPAPKAYIRFTLRALKAGSILRKLRMRLRRLSTLL